MMILAYGLVLGLFRAWTHYALPPDAPRIAFSLDDTWLNELGIMDSTYRHAMARAGGRLIDFSPAMAGAADMDTKKMGALLDEHSISGVLLGGGGDVDPRLYGGSPDSALQVNRLRDDFEIALIGAAQARNLPVLAICRGCQILNVACGGTLLSLRENKKLKDYHFNVSGHPVSLKEGSMLRNVLGTADLGHVQSFHGQAVDKPGKGISIVSRSADGVAEAIEMRDSSGKAWMIGVQFHPELAQSDDTQHRLFQALVARAGARH
jgi:putative glutamine amidotransferase